jgi:hypothetical protein
VSDKIEVVGYEWYLEDETSMQHLLSYDLDELVSAKFSHGGEVHDLVRVSDHEKAICEKDEEIAALKWKMAELYSWLHTALKCGEGHKCQMCIEDLATMEKEWEEFSDGDMTLVEGYRSNAALRSRLEVAEKVIEAVDEFVANPYLMQFTRREGLSTFKNRAQAMVAALSAYRAANLAPISPDTKFSPEAKDDRAGKEGI